MRRWMGIGLALGLGLGCGGGGAPMASVEPATGGESETVAAEAEPAAPEPDTSPEAPGIRQVEPHGPLLEPDLHRGVMARLRDPRFPSCTVGALPPAARRRVTPSSNDELARAVSMTLPERTVSAGRAGDDEIAIYLSSRLDPETEIGDLGYRVRLRHGANEEDLSLGLTALRPLVLVHNPLVPLVQAGVLQLEAQLRAIDDASIDFVPADATTTIRSERDLLVRCALDDLRRDQDHDGLTDIEEERLVTDAWDPDTDGDGTRDGEDRSPLGSVTATEPADVVWLAAYRELVRPELRDGLAIVVRSGARLDVGTAGTGRVLVLREDELGAYQRRFGLRPPLVIAVTMRGEDRARVEVDDAWSEGIWDARREGERWSFTRRGGARRGAGAR